MITFSRLGKKGNLGNQLFQVASTIGLAKRHNHEYVLPHWEHAHYFDYNFPIGSTEGFKTLHEKHFPYYEWNLGRNNYDILGYLQSEKYFDRPFTKRMFTIKPEVFRSTQIKQNLMGDPKNIIISVRRGDFVHHPWFYQISYKYYLGALLSYFPDYKSRNLIFTSDDIEYCKIHFSSLPNANFLENLTPIQQLAFATTCKDFIISNSTFSWWLAWMGEKSDSTIVRPLKNFRGKHAIKNNEADYFPNRWEIFDHESYHLPFKFYKIILKGEVYGLAISLVHVFEKTPLKIRKLISKKTKWFYKFLR